MRCADLMKKDTVCVGENVTVQEAASLMQSRNVGFLPVCDSDHRVLGTITDRDITIRVSAQDLKASTTRVGDVASRGALACRPDDGAEKAAELMAREKKSRIVVTDEAGKHLGVISLSDVAVRGQDAAKTLAAVASRETRKKAAA